MELGATMELGGGRGGQQQSGAGGQRRQNPKQALKKTEEDFPTL